MDDDELLLGGKYFRSILWMLATTPTVHSEQIEKLRVKLGRHPLNYIWFAKQSQSMYGFCSEDFHDETKVANLKYIDLKFIKQYVEGLPTDLRKAMLLLWDVE